MNYELAKKLKDAGFPQRLDINPALSYQDVIESKDNRALVQYVRTMGVHLVYDSSCGETIEQLRSKDVSEWNGKGRPSYYFSRDYIESSEGQELLAYAPTLLELMNSFPMGYIGIEQHSNDWRAGTLKQGGLNEMEVGYTPDEAMVKLWITLNKKKI